MADAALKWTTPGIVHVALFGSHPSLFLGRQTHRQEAHCVRSTTVCRMVHGYPCLLVICCSPLRQVVPRSGKSDAISRTNLRLDEPASQSNDTRGPGRLAECLTGGVTA